MKCILVAANGSKHAACAKGVMQVDAGLTRGATATKTLKIAKVGHRHDCAGQPRPRRH